MDEKEVQALKDKVAELEAEVKVAKDNETKAVAGQTATVEELKELRTKKQEVEAKLTLAMSQLNPSNPSQGNVEETVKKVLEAKEEEKLVGLRESVERKFKESHTEFHPDNDTGGLKYEAFKQKLSRINLNGLKSEEELMSAFDDAFVLMNKGATNQGSNFNPYAATIKNNSGDPKGVSGNKLANNELKLIAQLGWTEERYLKVKKAQPHYVESMLAQFK